MDYRVYELEVPASEYDLATSELFEAGALGVEIVSEGETVTFKAYFKEGSLPERLKPYLKSVFPLEERDWNSEWKKHYAPVNVGSGIWVVPSWMKGEFKEPEGSLVIYIRPGRGFGTGTHETTKLAMRFIKKLLKEGDSFLDVGCGSGILSILAAKLGASEVVGCDIQPNLQEEIEENQRLNGVEFTFVEGSVNAVNGKFDLVVANIEKHHLEPLLPLLAEKFKGTLILSGILTSQRDQFVKTLEKLGLRVVEEAKEGEWCAFVARK
ncbi:50S ribosomal protein L11 methyltransferase [Thermovibrio ammonificans]